MGEEGLMRHRAGLGGPGFPPPPGRGRGCARRGRGGAAKPKAKGGSGRGPPVAGSGSGERSRRAGQDRARLPAGPGLRSVLPAAPRDGFG